MSAIKTMVAFPDGCDKVEFLEKFPLGAKVQSTEKDGWFRVVSHEVEGIVLVKYVTQKDRDANRRARVVN